MDTNTLLLLRHLPSLSLLHSVDPENNPTPRQYQGKPIQYLGDKQTWYSNLINGCVAHYGDKGGRRCLNNERERVQMSVRQPQSMVNYTEHGFTKIRAPERVFQLIKEFWDENKDKGKPEMTTRGNTLMNTWEAPTTIVGVHDGNLKGGGIELQQNIWNSVRDTISVRK